MTSHQVPETPLPEPGDSGEEAHATISHRFRQHTVIEVQKGNRLQASEKIWAAVAHQLKALAEDRGWANDSHQHIGDIAWQLYRETGDRGIMDRFRNVESMHTNFYENERTWDRVEDAWVDAEELVERLETLRGQVPSAYRPRSESDQVRLARLMGYDPRELSADQRRAVLELFPLNVSSTAGFAPNYGYRPPGPDGGNSGGTPTPRGPAGRPPAPGGPALGQITQMGATETPASSALERTSRSSRPSGRTRSQAPAKPRKPRGRHAFWRRGEG